MNNNLIDKIKNKDLRTIAEKVYKDVPVDEADGMCMLTTTDILELGLVAHFLRTRLYGDIAYYSVNMNLNYTNICELRCPLCAFSRSEDDEGAFTLTLEAVESRVREMVSYGIDEVHIVGGLNPTLKIDYFEEMLSRIKSIKASIFIVAFTAVEYDYFARINGLSLEEVLIRMKNAGLGALPGGGSEIFAPEIRRIIAPKKISGKRWLEVMKAAHGLGLKTNATLLYNHLERPEDIVSHLSQVRRLQDETGGFKTFVPLPYHDAQRGVAPRRHQSTGFDDIRLFAASRIFLHNVPHIKALWMYLGEKMAQTLLRFGVDDLGGTYHHEKVVHSAGASTSDTGNELHLKRLIENAGLQAVRAVASYEMRGSP
ncbi:MAG: CofH family radical SAM protein [Proteobacteria bacterium]|nr:CofH family radical SAM protein [Pseudomonadota bacterium]